MKTQIQTLTIIYFALLAGTVMFLAAGIFIVNENPPVNDDKEFEMILKIVLVSLCVTGPFIGNFLFFKQLGDARLKENLSEKLKIYQTGLLIKLSLIEAAGLFSIVAYILTGNMLMLAGYVFAFLMFLVNRPSVSRVAMHLELSPEEKEKLY
jgi:hypothetical protein